ncbi:hypothetical protein Tco_0693986, partial [Tanacetum coccineum]
MQEDSGPGKEHVALAGPNPEHIDEDFYATAYPKVHENLKLRTRSQDGIDDKDNDKGSKSRSQSMKEQAYNEDKDQEHSSLNDKSNLTDLMKEYSEKQQMQLIQENSKESCMVSFQQLHSHLKCLSNNDLKGSRTEDGFKRAFATLFGQNLETFTGTMFLYMDQLQKQLDNEEFQEIGSMSAFKQTTDTSNALDSSSVIIESNGTESKEQATSSRSGNDAHV